MFEKNVIKNDSTTEKLLFIGFSSKNNDHYIIMKIYKIFYKDCVYLQIVIL